MARFIPRTFYLILILALLLRIGLVIAEPATTHSIQLLPDQREYLSIAQNLLLHGSLSFYDVRFGQTVYAYRMPGYPLFLAACGCSISVARLAQCLIDVSTALAVFLIARRLTGCTRVGRIAALLMAVNPFFIFFSSLLLSETIFASLVTWGVYFLLQFPKRRYAVGTLFLVAAAYLKTTGLVLVPVLAFTFALNNLPVTSYGLSRLARWCLLFCVPVTVLFSLELCLFMIPWVWRNHQILGVSIVTTTNSGITLYDGFHTGATGASDQRFIGGFTRSNVDE